jgi:hypothetical protein
MIRTYRPYKSYSQELVILNGLPIVRSLRKQFIELFNSIDL